MEIFKVRNVHQAYPAILERMDQIGIVRDSRNGPVLMFAEPATVVFQNPTERVLFWGERDTNPFFNLIEAIWMMASRRDVKFVEQFVKRMRNFSDNGKNFHAAYGYRWRKNFGQDQLTKIIEGLNKNPECRRQILGIWDVRKDLGREGLDTPCNISASFQVNHEGQLNMVVHNRSNDLTYGNCGTNPVHFSILQEYIAAGINAPVGKYWQVSSNLHVYMSDFEKFKGLSIHAPDPYRTVMRCPYAQDVVTTTPVVDIPLKEWEEDLAMWMHNPIKVGLRSQFFLRTATPMMMAHRAHKKGDTLGAIEIIQSQMMNKSDWKVAALEWLGRRLK